MSKEITKKKPEKSLLRTMHRTGGRNSTGRITAWQRGGGHRKKYRLIDFGQERFGVNGSVLGIEYDPNRNAYIALIQYEDSTKGYILAPQKLNEGDAVVCDEKADIKTGNRMRMAYIPVGTEIHNVELEPGRGGKIVRGAGAVARVMAQEGKYTLLTLPSKEARRVPSKGFATVGAVSNQEHRYQRVPKAGRTRNKGRRPNVRGSAMNPVDHPHGGGEGRTGIGMKHPKTPWGKPALGVKTRRKKRSDALIIRRRGKKK